MKTEYPLPSGYRRAICPCSCMIEGDAIEDRLRAHVEQGHPGAGFRDVAGQIIIRRATTFERAHRLVCEGFPLILETPAGGVDES